MAASAAASAGKIVIGFVTPQTGQLAGFASGDSFVVDRVRASDAYAKGFQVGGKTYDVEIVVKDTQSDPNRASQVAQELILQDNVDLVVTTSTPETTNPVAQICETQGVPCLSTVVPWQAWFFGRQADPANPVPFKYTTMFFFGAETFGGCFVPMWNRISTDKVVAGMFPNDADGNAFRGVWPDVIKQAGYTWVDGGAYPNLTTDYTAMISKFKDAKADIFINAPLPPGVQHVLEAGRPAGLQAEARDRRQGPALPGRHRGAGRPRQQHRDRLLVGSVHALQVVAHRRVEQGPRRRLPGGVRASSGSRASARPTRCSRSRSWPSRAVQDPHAKDDVAAALGKVEYSGICGPLDFAKGPFPGIGMMRPVGVQWKKGTHLPVGDGRRRQQPEPGRRRSVVTSSRPTPEPVGPLLELRQVSKAFGRVVVAEQLSMSVVGCRRRRDRGTQRRRQDQPVRDDRRRPDARSAARSGSTVVT